MLLRAESSGWGLGSRLIACGAFVSLEWALISFVLHPGVGGSVFGGFAAPFLACFLAFGYLRVKPLLPSISEQLRSVPLRLTYVAAHLAALTAFVHLFASIMVIEARPYGPALPLVASLYAAALLSILFALLAVIPANVCGALLQRTGNTWAYAAACGLLTASVLFVFFNNAAVVFFDWAWETSPDQGPKLLTLLTFRSVTAVLRPLLTGVSADPLTMRIATPHFGVYVGANCSGIEGLILILAFTTTWLVYCRRELRFPRVLILIPVALLVIWLANVARIAVLILIGHFVSKEVARNGFHSQAGWISFCIVSLVFAATAGRLQWFSRAPSDDVAHKLRDIPTAAFLMPFLAILSASMISRAVTADFEWLYPLRLVGAAAALWFFRPTLRSLDWRVGWSGFFAGGIAFVIWILLDQWTGGGNDAPLASALARQSVFTRDFWLACRVVAAIVTVPIAEELAFRGYLARWLTARDFETVSFQHLTIVSIVVSSLAFGLMHGSAWVAGAIVGALYAAVLRRSGRIGDAVAAHATTNALLAVWVLSRGAWHLL